jgi:chromosome segregation ATPase
MGAKINMSKEINRKLDKALSTLSDIRVSQARTEERLESAIKLQEKHEKQLNDPEGAVAVIKQRVNSVEKAVNGIKIYLGIIATSITLIINFFADWVMSFFGK